VDYFTVLNNAIYIFKFQSVNSFTEEDREIFRNIMDTVSISTEIIRYNYVSIIGIVLLVIAGIIFLVKRKMDKTKCPYCKLKINPRMEFCPRCGNCIK